MKSAIITGAAGFIGSTLVNLLLQNNYKVVALGRVDFESIKLERLYRHENLLYIKLNLEDITKLPQILKNYPEFNMLNSTFFHFAWGGDNQLSDMNIEAQLRNVVWTLKSFEVANDLRASKFIFVGTMEEFFAKKYLDLDFNVDSYFNRHVVYALAKTTARNYLKLISHEFDTKIIYATNSHVMGPKDHRDSFLQVALKKLIAKEKLLLTDGEQYFDVISSMDCAMAYQLIAEKGKANSEYWIGSGFPKLLKDYVIMMAELFPEKHPLKFGEMDFNDIGLEKSQFSISLLKRDTGFEPKNTFEDILKELKNYLNENIF